MIVAKKKAHKKKDDGRRKVANSDHPDILRRVREGQSLAHVGKIYKISRQRVRQIVVAHNPAWGTQYTPPAPRPHCVIHPDRPVGYHRAKYCSDECAQAVVILREITSYRPLRLAAMNGGVEVKRQRRQILHRSSAWYKVLKRNGLLDRLPKSIKVVD